MAADKKISIHDMSPEDVERRIGELKKEKVDFARIFSEAVMPFENSDKLLLVNGSEYGSDETGAPRARRCADRSVFLGQPGAHSEEPARVV